MHKVAVAKKGSLKMKTMKKTGSVMTGPLLTSVTSFLADWGGTLFGLSLAAVLLRYLVSFG